MCEIASFIVTKDNVYWSLFTDSHEEIISEVDLVQDGVRGPNIVRVASAPPGNHQDHNCGFLEPLDKWHFAVDYVLQPASRPLLPEWYDAVDCERRTRAALEQWCKARLITSGGPFVRSSWRRQSIRSARNHSTGGGQ